MLTERYAASKHGALIKDVVVMGGGLRDEALRKARAEFARLRVKRTFQALIARYGAEMA